MSRTAALCAVVGCLAAHGCTGAAAPAKPIVDAGAPDVRGLLVEAASTDMQKGDGWGYTTSFDVSSGGRNATLQQSECDPAQRLAQYCNSDRGLAFYRSNAPGSSSTLVYASTTSCVGDNNVTIITYRASSALDARGGGKAHRNLQELGRCSTVLTDGDGNAVSFPFVVVDPDSGALYVLGTGEGSGGGAYCSTMLRVHFGPGGDPHTCKTSVVASGLPPSTSERQAPSWSQRSFLYPVQLPYASYAVVDMTQPSTPSVQVILDSDLTIDATGGMDTMRWVWLDPNWSNVVWGIGQISILGLELAQQTQHWHPTPGGSTINPPNASSARRYELQESYDPFPYIQVSDFGILPSPTSGLDNGAWMVAVESVGTTSMRSFAFNPVTNASVETVHDMPNDAACNHFGAYPDGRPVLFVPTGARHD